jgi:hypothetical protein
MDKEYKKAVMKFKKAYLKHVDQSQVNMGDCKFEISTLYYIQEEIAHALGKRLPEFRRLIADLGVELKIIKGIGGS